MAAVVDPFYEQLGRRLAVARSGRGMTQDQVGRGLVPPLSRASIANIEQGKQRVLVHVLVQIAGLLAVRVEELLPEGLRRNPSAPSMDARGVEEALRRAKVPQDAIRQLASKFKPGGTP